jgi:uncharacterized protein (DUF362 family)
MEINRRYFFLGCLALAGCRKSTRSIAQFPEQLVSIVRAGSYQLNLTGMLRRILLEHKVAVAGKRILLKPNLVEFAADAPINTHPVFVAAAMEAFLSLGAADVRIAEGPGHRRMTLDLADAAGYFSAIDKFEDRFTDLNLDRVQRVAIQNGFSTLKELYLPETVLGCDLLVSLAKMKTHHWVGATLAMKNLFGVVPGGVYGWPKNILHWAGIHESIADLQALFPRQFCFVDGIEAMEGNGPILGTRKMAGLIVAGAHPPSVDATCCQLMDLDPAKIGYLDFASRRSGWTPLAVRQAGETIPATATRFEVIPEFASLRIGA